MPRPALLCVALVLVSGCGDPANDVLTPGQMVVVSAENGTTLQRSDKGGIFPKLAAGATARVGSDLGYRETPDDMTLPEEKNRPAEKIAPPDRRAGYRYIKVTVETGQHAGASGEVMRNDVRPLP